MAQSRLTLNIQCQYVADWGKTLDFLRKLDPIAVVACIDNMNALNRVLEIQQALPLAKIIGRFVFPSDGAMHLKPQAAGDTRQWIVSPGDALNAWGELGTHGRTLYLLNEPLANGAIQEDIGRLVQWMIETIGLATSRGISLCCANFGVGHPALLPSGEYDARFDDVLTILSKQRDLHSLGIHVYQPADTFTRLDGIIKRCKALGIKPPRIHITEAGFDAGSGGDSLNGYKSRGYSGSQFAAFQVDKIKNVYSPYIADDNLQSVATFCWGNDASWKNFNVETDPDWQTTILDAQSKGLLSVTKLITKPFLMPIPKPIDASLPTRIRVKNTEINVRSGYGTDYTKAGVLKASDEVTLFQTPFKQGTTGQVWRWVDIDDKFGGWVSSDALSYEIIPPPVATPPPVISLPPPPPLASVYLMTAAERAEMLGHLLALSNLLIGLQETKPTQLDHAA